MEIAVFLFEGVTALDAIGPFESLVRLPEAKISFVSKAGGLVTSGDGFVSLMSVDLASVHACDLLIVPGGRPNGLGATFADAELHKWIRRIDETTRWTCSVCTGALILGSAGVLKGRTASTHFRAKDHLARFGIAYSADRVTTDEKYVSSAGVTAGIDMGLILCGLIAGREIAEAIELSMQYDPEPPYGTGKYKVAATTRRIDLMNTALRI